jgi:hypothetical protein
MSEAWNSSPNVSINNCPFKMLAAYCTSLYNSLLQSIDTLSMFHYSDLNSETKYNTAYIE